MRTVGEILNEIRDVKEDLRASLSANQVNRDVALELVEALEDLIEELGSTVTATQRMEDEP